MFEGFPKFVDDSRPVALIEPRGNAFGCEAARKECLMKLVDDEAPFPEKIYAIHKSEKTMRPEELLRRSFEVGCIVYCSC